MYGRHQRARALILLPLCTDGRGGVDDRVFGSAEIVMLRGNILVENDELVAKPGIGRYVACAKFGRELASTGAAVPGSVDAAGDEPGLSGRPRPW